MEFVPGASAQISGGNLYINILRPLKLIRRIRLFVPAAQPANIQLGFNGFLLTSQLNYEQPPRDWTITLFLCVIWMQVIARSATKDNWSGLTQYLIGQQFPVIDMSS